MKLLFQYTILVALSVLIILGILRAGRDLEAPTSVGGRWELDLPVEAAACLPISTRTGPPVLSISQSGLDLVLSFNEDDRATLSGKLDGSNIEARSNFSGMHLAAVIDRQLEPDRLHGTLTTSQCPEAIKLDGVRIRSLASLSGEH
jgi:hypothetical protein